MLHKLGFTTRVSTFESKVTFRLAIIVRILVDPVVSGEDVQIR